jgi:hypothetical protein
MLNVVCTWMDVSQVIPRAVGTAELAACYRFLSTQTNYFPAFTVAYFETWGLSAKCNVYLVKESVGVHCINCPHF